MLLIVLLAALLEPGAARPNQTGFDTDAAWRLLRLQVRLGPRPAGSQTSRRLAEILLKRLPHGGFEAVPGGLRNVVGVVPGKDRREFVVVGAHYDTKDIPGFVGANDGASGVAVVVQLARAIRPRELRPTIVFILFDGEESPRGTPDSQFVLRGLRGSRVAAARYRHAAAMILLDMIGDRSLSVVRDQSGNRRLWALLRASARSSGTARAFPGGTIPVVYDDQTPFERVGVPSIDLIDFTYPCWHKRCDDLAHVSQRSIAVVGQTVLALLARLR